MRKIILFTVIMCNLIIAQHTNNFMLSGSLKNDTQFALKSLVDSNSAYNLSITQSTKTPILAGLMSFVIPGGGQIYTENYLKAGIFAAVEIGAIVLAVTYDGKGNDQTDFYENYANKNWSAEQYAKWTLANLDKNEMIAPDLNPEDYKVIENGQVNWKILNELENDIGGYYSHKLAPFGDQQYYEMIGKYPQFNVGWIDFGDDVNKPFDYSTPVEEQFKWYSKERGKANDYYNVAKWAVIAVVSNHFISAIDAAWSASRYNKRMKFNISIEEESIGFNKEYYPQINLSYNF